MKMDWLSFAFGFLFGFGCIFMVIALIARWIGANLPETCDKIQENIKKEIESKIND